MRNIIKTVFILIAILFFPMIGLAAEDIDYKKNVKDFVNNPDKEFTIEELVQNNDFKKVLLKHLDKDEYESITWNELKQSIQKKDGVFGDHERITINHQRELNDFKIFKQIKVTEIPKVVLYTDRVFFEEIPYLTKIDLDIRGQSELTTIDFSPLENLREIKLKGSSMTDFNVNNPDRIIDLHLETNKIKNFNPMKFKNLQSVSLNSMNFEILDLTEHPTLKSFYANNLKADRIILKDVDGFLISDSEANQLTVTNANNNEIWLRDNNIKEITLEKFNHLENIYIHNSETSSLKEITFNQVPKLRTIDIRDTLLSNITFIDTPKVEDIFIMNSKLKEFDLSTLPNLMSLDLLNAEIKNIDLSQAPQLKGLSLSYNDIEEIDVRSLKNLESLYLNRNKLTSIHLKGLKKLKRINLSDNKLTDIDLSDQTQTEILYLNDNDLTSLLPIKPLLKANKIKALHINNNKVNLLSSENRPIHEQLKKKITGEQDGFGPDYQYFYQRVEQVGTTKQDGEFVHTFMISEQIKGKRKQIPGTHSYITFPSDLLEGVELEIKEVPTEKAHKLLPKSDGLKVAGDVFEFTFNNDYIQDEPFTLSLSYDGSTYNLKEWDVGIYYYNEKTGEWEFIGGDIDPSKGIVTAEINHFSTYGVLATSKEDSSQDIHGKAVDNDNSKEVGKRLPNTSTSFYNFIAFGLSLLILGGFFLYRINYKHMN